MNTSTPYFPEFRQSVRMASPRRLKMISDSGYCSRVKCLAERTVIWHDALASAIGPVISVAR